MQNEQTQSLNSLPTPSQGPVEIDTQLLHLVSGGSSQDAPETQGSSTAPLPKSGW